MITRSRVRGQQAGMTPTSSQAQPHDQDLPDLPPIRRSVIHSTQPTPSDPGPTPSTSQDPIDPDPNNSAHMSNRSNSQLSLSPLFEQLEYSDSILNINSPILNHGDNSDELFSVERINEETFQSGLARAVRFKIVPLPGMLNSISPTTIEELEEVIKTIFTTITSAFRESCQPQDIIKFVLDQEKLDTPIIIPPCRIEALNVNDILVKIVNVLQSKKEVQVDRTFYITASVIRVIAGGVSKSRLLLSEDENVLYAKKSIVRISNETTKTCLARAILVSWAFNSKIDEVKFMKHKNLHDRDLIDTSFRVKKTCYSFYKSLRDPRLSYQDQATSRLLSIVGLSKKEQIGLEHIDVIEDFLQCGVYVISQVAGNQFVRRPSDRIREEGLVNVFVYHHRIDHDDITSPFHFDAITKLAGFFGVKSMCLKCFRMKSDRNVACCGRTRCVKCCQIECQNKSPIATPLSCRACTTSFPYSSCFENHKKYKVCESKWTCVKCNKSYEYSKRVREQHMCGEYFCRICERYFIDRHDCYIRAIHPTTKLKNDIDRVLIFFDIESRQSKINECQRGYVVGKERCVNCVNQEYRCSECSKCLNCRSVSCKSLLHEANVVVCQKVCNSCHKLPFRSMSKCDVCGSRCSSTCRKRNPHGNVRDYIQKKACPTSSTCGLREAVFFGEDCMTSFLRWLIVDEHNGARVFSHNGSSYDHILLLHELLLKKKFEPARVIFSGSKLLYMELVNPVAMKFLDSYKFLSYPLSALPKAFGLEMDVDGGPDSSLAKGYFPHLFNTKENESFIGEYPSPEYYSYSSMKPEAAAVFLEWYEEKINSGSVFDFRQEIISYCRNDVNILRLVCLKFRELVEGLTGVDPFHKCITLASLAMRIYRTLFITEMFKATLMYRDESDPDSTNSPSPTDTIDLSLSYNLVERGGKAKINLDDGWGYRSIDELPRGVIIKQKTFESTFLGRVPPGGYRQYLHGQSKIGLQWLELMSKRYGKRVYHAGNWSEIGIRVKGGRVIYADGFIPGDGRILKMKEVVDRASPGDIYLSFEGCYHHSCVHCFPFGRDIVKCHRTNRTWNEIYQETVQKNEMVERMGFVVVSVWEHEFRNQMKEDKNVREMVESFPVFSPPLDPRMAYYGGRVEVYSMLFEEAGVTSQIENEYLDSANDHHESTRDRCSLLYDDITSLYPAMMSTKTYCLGHPDIVTCGLTPSNLFEFFGIATVTILPPRGLLYPILPFRCHNKLLFPLCRTCCEKGCSGEIVLSRCTCSKTERQLTGSWVTPELELAVETGYQIITVHEVYYFKSTSANTIDPFTGTKVNLFRDYVDMFLKIKVESSGFPRGVKTDSEKEKYITSYYENEGIQLDPALIEENPAKRNMAKILLNSLYGKFSQNVGKSKTIIVNQNNPSDLVKVITDPAMDIVDFNILDCSTLILEYCQRQESLSPGPTDNVCIAAYVTAFGRMKLYSLLKKTHPNAMYVDTDSIIYKVRSDHDKLELGPYLGELTSEIPEGARIQTFLATGPKSYAYCLSNGDSVLKMKGFTLSISASQHMNLESMRDLIYDFAIRLRKQVTDRNKLSEDEQIFNDFECLQELEKNHPSTKLTVVIANDRIFRIKRTMSVNTRQEVKRYSLIADKRVFFPDLTSIPYGY